MECSFIMGKSAEGKTRHITYKIMITLGNCFFSFKFLFFIVTVINLLET